VVRAHRQTSANTWRMAPPLSESVGGVGVCVYNETLSGVLKTVGTYAPKSFSTTAVAAERNRVGQPRVLCRFAVFRV
jgi:hypothetical protein